MVKEKKKSNTNLKFFKLVLWGSVSDMSKGTLESHAWYSAFYDLPNTLKQAQLDDVYKNYYIYM
jgi:hypothetical protein